MGPLSDLTSCPVPSEKLARPAPDIGGEPCVDAPPCAGSFQFSVAASSAEEAQNPKNAGSSAERYRLDADDSDEEQWHDNPELFAQGYSDLLAIRGPPLSEVPKTSHSDELHEVPERAVSLAENVVDAATRAVDTGDADTFVDNAGGAEDAAVIPIGERVVLRQDNCKELALTSPLGSYCLGIQEKYEAEDLSEVHRGTLGDQKEVHASHTSTPISIFEALESEVDPCESAGSDHGSNNEIDVDPHGFEVTNQLALPCDAGGLVDPGSLILSDSDSSSHELQLDKRQKNFIRILGRLLSRKTEGTSTAQEDLKLRSFITLAVGADGPVASQHDFVEALAKLG